MRSRRRQSKWSIGQRGFSLPELSATTFGASVLFLIFGALIGMSSAQFRAMKDKMEAEMQLLRAGYSLRRHTAQARDLAAVPDANNFFGAPGGRLLAGPPLFDSAAVLDNDTNQGRIFALAKFDREEGSAAGSRFFGTSVFFRMPNRNGTSNETRSGALIIDQGADTPIVDLAPTANDLTYSHLSRLRIVEVNLYPESNQVVSVKFELTARYFPFAPGRTAYWFQTAAQPGEASPRDITHEVLVVLRNNLLHADGGLTGASTEVRPLNGLYFFKPVVFLEVQ